MNKKHIINIIIITLIWMVLGTVLLIFALDVHSETTNIQELTERVEQLEEQNDILERSLAEVDWGLIALQYLNENIKGEQLLILVINVLEYHDFHDTLDREVQRYVEEYFGYVEEYLEDLLMEILEEIQPTS